MQFPACVSFLLVLILLYIHLYSATLFCVFFCPQGGFQSLIGPNKNLLPPYTAVVFFLGYCWTFLTYYFTVHVSIILIVVPPTKRPIQS